MDRLLITYGTEMDDFNPVSQVRSCQPCSSSRCQPLQVIMWMVKVLLQIPATFKSTSCALQCFIFLIPWRIA